MNRLLLVMLCLMTVQTQTIKKTTRQAEYKCDIRKSKSDLLHFSVIANFTNETQQRIASASQATLKSAYEKLKESRIDVQSWLDEMEKLKYFTKTDKQTLRSYMQAKYRINEAIRTILRKVPSLKKNRLTKYVRTPSRLR